MNAVDTAHSATITVADTTYARLTRLFNTPDITGYERAESEFLSTRADSADHVIHKLQPVSYTHLTLPTSDLV